MGLKAVYILKKNIDALLQARGQKRKELAQYCGRTEAWMSQIFTKPHREIPLKYLDRIADFFGLAPYQLFQPGISPLTERRKGGDRRSGVDRRVIDVADVRAVVPSQAELEQRMRALPPDAYRRFARRVEAALTLGAPTLDGEDQPDRRLPDQTPRAPVKRTRRRG
jgi:transcriptional regulator with XRE-family HTH domain